MMRISNNCLLALILVCICLLSLKPGTGSAESSWPDLSKLAQDYVLEEKQIIIPGYPDAFNPSLIRWNERLLMAFRIRDPVTKSTNKIGFVWLNDEYEADSSIQELDIKVNDPAYPALMSWAQDPRLVQVGEDLFMVYSNLLGSVQGILRRVFWVKLHVSDDGWVEMDIPMPILSYPGEIILRQEKNWAPFDYNGTLLLAYSINPHRIFALEASRPSVNTVAETNCLWNWPWGEIRGGTPAIELDGQYLAFLHSSKEMKTAHSNGVKMSHYFIGAYTFSKEPPFALQKISPEPIFGRSFYVGPAYTTWKPLRAIFPCGYVYDSQFIWIVYGKQDHEAWVIKIDRKRLLDSLTTVTH